MAAKIAALVVYFVVVAALGWLGYRRTRSSDDFAIAGRAAGPVVVGLSYGATFISTAAVIGFGGLSAQLGLVTLWLASANVVLSIGVAMLWFGPRARRLAERLEIQTFPELLARRFDSPLLGRLVAALIVVFMPVYGAAVLIGIARVLEVSLGVPFDASVVVVLASTGLYVVVGGLRAVLYTDAFQAVVMCSLMPVVLALVLAELGGLGAAVEALASLAPKVPEALRADGLRGYVAGPAPGSPLFVQIVTSTILAVSIGAIAQPQLVIRCIALRSDRELRSAAVVGMIATVLVVGVSFAVGAFSNALFFAADGTIAVASAGGNLDRVIPLTIERFLPAGIAVLFMVAMLAAAMSTISSLVHVGATTLARDLGRADGVAGERMFRRLQFGAGGTTLALAVWAWALPGSVIAQATSIFFGLVAAAFLPTYGIALFTNASARAAVATFTTGASVWLVWAAFGFEPLVARLGLLDESLVTATPLAWAGRVDPALLAIPAALIAAAVSSRRETVSR